MGYTSTHISHLHIYTSHHTCSRCHTHTEMHMQHNGKHVCPGIEPGTISGETRKCMCGGLNHRPWYIWTKRHIPAEKICIEINQRNSLHIHTRITDIVIIHIISNILSKTRVKDHTTVKRCVMCKIGVTGDRTGVPGVPSPVTITVTPSMTRILKVTTCLQAYLGGHLRTICEDVQN